ECIEQVRMTRTAPWPAGTVLPAEMLDRAFVDLDHRDLARRDRFPWPPLDDRVEDRVLGGGQVALVGPVPGQPGQRQDRQQRIEGKAEPQRELRIGTAITTLDPF